MTVDVLELDGEQLEEVIVNRRQWGQFPPDTRVRVADLRATRRELLEACREQLLVAADGRLLVRSADAVLIEVEQRARDAAERRSEEAERRRTALEAGDHAAVDARHAPLLSQGMIKLRAQMIEREEQLARGREDVAIAKAALEEASETHRVLVVRVMRGDRDATKERDTAEKRLDAAARTLRDAEIVLEADVAKMQPEITELQEAIGILEERDAAARQEREAAKRRAAIVEAHRRAASLLVELRAALDALDKVTDCGLRHTDVLEGPGAHISRQVLVQCAAHMEEGS